MWVSSKIGLLFTTLGMAIVAFTSFSADPDDDVETVRGAFHAKGFSDREIDQLVATVSQKMRREDATMSSLTVDPQRFVNLATSMGLVVVESTPPGASVKIDNENPSCGEKTSLRCWVHKGAHNITLTMDGYWPESGTCEVSAEDRVTFSRTLRPRP
jgi:hypothetical protein